MAISRFLSVCEDDRCGDDGSSNNDGFGYTAAVIVFMVFHTVAWWRWHMWMSMMWTVVPHFMVWMVMTMRMTRTMEIMGEWCRHDSHSQQCGNQFFHGSLL